MCFFRRVDGVDGVRAIAVLGVIFAHVGWLGGGFIGVDIFFVVSGYVITLSVLHDWEEGRFRALEFFRRRISRIVPPLLVVSALTYLAAWYVMVDPAEHQFFSESYFFQAFCVQNFFFAQQATEYFRGIDQAKFNLHLWSIAVEEQFYFIFPIFVALNPPGRGRRFVPAILVCIAVAAAAASRVIGTYAYYLLVSRAWELVLGSAACLWARRIAAVGSCGFIHRVRESQATFLLAIAAIVVAMRFTRPTMEWPGAMAILPTVSTGILMVQLHLGRGRWAHRILSNAPMQYVGKISYSLYLYHWPLYALLVYTNSDFGSSASDHLAYFLVLGALSATSYHVIEARRGRIGAVGAAGILSAYVLFHLAVWRVPPRVPEDGSSEIARMVKTGQRAGDRVASVDVPTGDFVLLWGDSHARAVLNTVARLCGERGLQLVWVKGIPIDFTRRGMHARARQLVDHPGCKGMLLVARWSMYLGLPEDEIEEIGTRYLRFGDVIPENPAEATETFRASFEHFMTEYGGIPTCIMLEVPRYPFIPKKEAIMRHLGLKLRPIREKTVGVHRNENALADALIETAIRGYPLANVLDPLPWLSHEGKCVWGRGSDMFYSDDDHLSERGAEEISPLLEQALDKVCGSAWTAPARGSRPCR